MILKEAKKENHIPAFFCTTICQINQTTDDRAFSMREFWLINEVGTRGLEHDQFAARVKQQIQAQVINQCLTSQRKRQLDIMCLLVDY